MPARRRAVAAFVSIAICAALHVATWKPLAVQAIFSPGIITTYAGGPGSGTGTAIAQSPWGLAVFGSTLYIADFDHSVVRALNTGTGTETVVAGDGTSGDSGQGGQATNAELNGPASVAVDS
ncbi:MAG TPA: hypothetical protein VNU19_04380, partial [Candidatus Acidoferrum sp.]|nr:hypothetical protein [Candidatus Acidoferrum sp.]